MLIGRTGLRLSPMPNEKDQLYDKSALRARVHKLIEIEEIGTYGKGAYWGIIYNAVRRHAYA